MSLEDQMRALEHEIETAQAEVADIEAECVRKLDRKKRIENTIAHRRGHLERLRYEMLDRPAAGGPNHGWAATSGIAQLKDWWKSKQYVETFDDPLIRLETHNCHVARERVSALNEVLKKENIHGGRIVANYTSEHEEYTAYYVRRMDY